MVGRENLHSVLWCFHDLRFEWFSQIVFMVECCCGITDVFRLTEY